MKRTPLPRRRRPLARGTWRAGYSARRVRRATPAWADADAIREVYREARELAALTAQPHEVDHVIPLIHADVCGLHVAANLRAVASWFNREKSNRFDPETFDGP